MERGSQRDARYTRSKLSQALDLAIRAFSSSSSRSTGCIPPWVMASEPSPVFRDELHNLFPTDESAGRLRKQTFLLSEFLQNHALNYLPPSLSRKVILHGHCHHKAPMKIINHEESLLRKTGVELQSLDSGGCGIAGPFGCQKDKFEISQATGERILLPAVRNAALDTLVVADGFSCREQRLQGAGRSAMHMAEVLKIALDRENSSEGG